MRGSFGGSYGLGRNAGGGGDGVMRTVGRVMRTRINGVQDPFPSSSNSHARKSSSTSPTKTRNINNNNNNKHALTISSPPNRNNDNNNPTFSPVVGGATWGGVSTCPCYNDVVGGNDGEIDDDEWEFMENYYNYDPLFGNVPSSHEVQHALFSLQHVFHPPPCSQFANEDIPSDADTVKSGQTVSTDILQRTSSMGSDRDWVEPSMHLYDQRMALSSEWERVYDAFHLLHTEPSVQKMVVSLSSDKAVWDAVLKNDIVREIRDTYLNAAEASPLSSDSSSSPSSANSNVLKWIIDHMKGKLLEVLGNITQFMGDLFKPVGPDKVEQTQAFSEKLKSTFLLTIVVLLIVVVTRGSKA